MKTTIDYYCKYCNDERRMKLVGKADSLGIYWLRCSSCSNCWKIQIDQFEKIAKK